MKKNLILKTIIFLTLTQNILTASQPTYAGAISTQNDTALTAQIETLNDLFEWQLDGQWSQEEIQPIFKAAWRLQKYVEAVTGTNGQVWMKESLGPITFHHQTLWNSLLRSHFALPNGNIYLFKVHSYSIFTPEDILHEITHVLDDRQGTTEMATIFGGGPSEQMVSELGGHPEACLIKAFCPLGYQGFIAGDESWDRGDYGNWSVADDFAETLSLAVFQPEQVPPTRLTWMQSYIVSTVD